MNINSLHSSIGASPAHAATRTQVAPQQPTAIAKPSSKPSTDTVSISSAAHRALQESKVATSQTTQGAGNGNQGYSMNIAAKKAYGIA